MRLVHMVGQRRLQRYALSRDHAAAPLLRLLLSLLLMSLRLEELWAHPMLLQPPCRACRHLFIVPIFHQDHQHPNQDRAHPPSQERMNPPSPFRQGPLWTAQELARHCALTQRAKALLFVFDPVHHHLPLLPHPQHAFHPQVLPWVAVVLWVPLCPRPWWEWCLGAGNPRRSMAMLVERLATRRSDAMTASMTARSLPSTKIQRLLEETAVARLAQAMSASTQLLRRLLQDRSLLWMLQRVPLIARPATCGKDWRFSIARLMKFRTCGNASLCSVVQAISLRLSSPRCVPGMRWRLNNSKSRCATIWMLLLATLIRWHPQPLPRCHRRLHSFPALKGRCRGWFHHQRVPVRLQ